MPTLGKLFGKHLKLFPALSSMDLSRPQVRSHLVTKSQKSWGCKAPLETICPTPLLKAVTWSRLLRTVSSWLSTLSKDRDSATSLCNLFQCFTTIPFILLSCVSICIHYVFPYHWIPQGRAWPVIFTPPIFDQVFIYFNKTPPRSALFKEK